MVDAGETGRFCKLIAPGPPIRFQHQMLGTYIVYHNGFTPFLIKDNLALTIGQYRMVVRRSFLDLEDVVRRPAGLERGTDIPTTNNDNNRRILTATTTTK